MKSMEGKQTPLHYIVAWNTPAKQTNLIIIYRFTASSLPTIYYYCTVIDREDFVKYSILSYTKYGPAFGRSQRKRSRTRLVMSWLTAVSHQFYIQPFAYPQCLSTFNNTYD